MIHSLPNTRVDVLLLSGALVGCQMLRRSCVIIRGPLVVNYICIGIRVATACNSCHHVSAFLALYFSHVFHSIVFSYVHQLSDFRHASSPLI